MNLQKLSFSELGIFSSLIISSSSSKNNVNHSALSKPKSFIVSSEIFNFSFKNLSTSDSLLYSDIPL